MLLKSLLVAVIGGLCGLDGYTLQTQFRKPLLAATLVGLVLGDVQTGLFIGATLELMFLGAVAVGSYVPPDAVTGAVVGTAIAILTGSGMEVGLATAIPVATLMQQVLMLMTTVKNSFDGWADKLALTGDFNAPWKIQVTAMIFHFTGYFLVCFIAVFAGAPAIESILAVIPAWLVTGLSVASNMIPALGIGMLLVYLVQKDNWFYLVISFVLANFLGLNLIAASILGVGVAALHLFLVGQKNESNVVVKQEEEYDL